MTCTHKLCGLCGRRSCALGLGTIKDYGSVSACEPCTRKAVQFALQVAMKWGGSLPVDECAFGKKEKP